MKKTIKFKRGTANGVCEFRGKRGLALCLDHTQKILGLEEDVIEFKLVISDKKPKKHVPGHTGNWCEVILLKDVFGPDADFQIYIDLIGVIEWVGLEFGTQAYLDNLFPMLTRGVRQRIWMRTKGVKLA